MGRRGNLCRLNFARFLKTALAEIESAIDGEEKSDEKPGEEREKNGQEERKINAAKGWGGEGKEPRHRERMREEGKEEVRKVGKRATRTAGK